MPNTIYNAYKQSLLAGDTNVDLDNDTVNDGVYALLIDTGSYTFSAAHQFYSQVSAFAGAIIAEQRIGGPTVTNGVLDGSDITFNSVTGANAEAIILYRRNAGANTTWRLVAFIDTGITGLPVLPNGGNITITWNALGIFAI